MSLCPHGVRIEHQRCDRCEEIAEAEHRRPAAPAPKRSTVTEKEINIMVRHLVTHGPTFTGREIQARPFWGDHGCDQCVKEFRIDKCSAPGPDDFVCGFHIAKRLAKERGIVP
jgi:hypothetical protein